MRYFWRSLRYLWPYRARLAVAVVCVLCIAVLWGGGLGLVLPGAKILIAPEGLHGWAYTALTEDHLGAQVTEQDPGEILFDGRAVDSVISLVRADEDSPAGQAGLARSCWLVGADGQVLRYQALMRRLAQADPGQTLPLVTYDSRRRPVAADGRPELKTVAVTMGKEHLVSRVLKRLAVTPGADGQPLIPEPKKYGDRFPLFAGLLVVVLVVTFLRAIFTFTQEYLVGVAIWRGVMDLRCQNYSVVLHLPTLFFSEQGVSDATSRFIQDTNELARGQNTLLGKTLVEPAKAISALGLALAMSWQLTLMAMVAGPPTFWLIRRLGKKMHKASRRALESWSSMLAVLGETLQGIRVVKAYTMEGGERKRFFRVNRTLLKQQSRMERLDAVTGPLVEVMGLSAGMVAAGLAGYLVFRGLSFHGYFYQMDRDYFLTWMVALFALFDPVRKLAKVSTKFQQADAAAQRVFSLQDTEQEKSVPNAPSLPRHSRSLEFRDVSFRYPSAAVDALRNVNLSIRAGETVAFVGPNGSGKTTLVSLVPRLFDPAAGTVLLDGLDITRHSVRSLRRQIGLVTQESVIFHASIAENISYGRRRAKRELVVEAARKAFVDEFVRELPDGYDTLVGEHGARLSGGQRQRIAIARAILRDPAIIIFDEALSQIDPDSERKIHQALEEFRRGRTTLVIAHRFATTVEADRIVVLDAGRIVDCGPHAELLQRCELYRKLYRTQFQDPGGG